MSILRSTPNHVTPLKYRCCIFSILDQHRSTLIRKCIECVLPSFAQWTNRSLSNIFHFKHDNKQKIAT